MVFSGQSVHAREVIYALVGLHFVQTVHSDAIVSPKDVPLVLIFVAIFVTLFVR